MGPDVSWTELERFLYDPSVEELQQKLMGQPPADRRRVAQALMASLEETDDSPAPLESTADVSHSPRASRPEPRSTVHRTTQTDGQVLVTYTEQTVHLSLHLRGGTLDPR